MSKHFCIILDSETSELLGLPRERHIAPWGLPFEGDAIVIRDWIERVFKMVPGTLPVELRELPPGWQCTAKCRLPHSVTGMFYLFGPDPAVTTINLEFNA